MTWQELWSLFSEAGFAVEGVFGMSLVNPGDSEAIARRFEEQAVGTP
jgi:hypothetical protein